MVHTRRRPSMGLLLGIAAKRRFDNEGFRKDLGALARQTGTAKPRLQLSFQYAGNFLKPDEAQAMEQAVTKMCREARFAKVRVGMTGEGGSWQDKVAKFPALTDEGNPTKSVVQNEFVQVYPVRKRLSRFLLGDAAEDCFIDL